MRLSQTEVDRVLVFNVAQMARARRRRGLRLNYPEAIALIADEMMELAREGADYDTVRSHGLTVLAEDEVLPGVPTLLRGLTCEPLFDDGPRIIVLEDPVPDSTESGPGEIRLAKAPIVINEGRDVVLVTVTNESDRVVNISSHYHFYEINPRMRFDRRAAYGRHLDIQAGRSVIWDPGQTREVALVPYAGNRVIDGFQAIAPPAGP